MAAATTASRPPPACHPARHPVQLLPAPVPAAAPCPPPAHLTLSTATTSEPKQIEPNDVVSARLVAPETGLGALSPSNHQVATAPAVATCTTLTTTRQPQ